MAAVGIDAAHGAQQFGGEQDVLGGNDVQEQVDARLMVNAGVEVNVVQHQFLQGRLALHGLHQPTEPAPMVGHGAAAVGDDELDGREVRQQVRSQHLHEGGGVRPQVMGAGGVEGWVAGGADVDHGGHVQFAQFLIEGIPIAVSQGRAAPVAAGRIRVQVAANEAELMHAALQLGDAVAQRGAGGLRQLRHAHEIVRVKPGDAVDQLVAMLGPVLGGVGVADVVPHPAGPGGEDGEVRAPLRLHLQLGALQAVTDLLVGDVDQALGAGIHGILRQRRLLGVPIFAQSVRRGGVVAVAVDDHLAVFQDEMPHRGVGGRHMVVAVHLRHPVIQGAAHDQPHHQFDALGAGLPHVIRQGELA